MKLSSELTARIDKVLYHRKIITHNSWYLIDDGIMMSICMINNNNRHVHHHIIMASLIGISRHHKCINTLTIATLFVKFVLNHSLL
jgi:hypothetical protein